ncbi:unnamed protein product, partial [Brenthis ino]
MAQDRQLNVLAKTGGSTESGGAILGGSTAWSLLRMSYYFWTSDLGVELGVSVLFIAGALLCLPACWLASMVPYHPRSVTLSATLMMLLITGMMLLSTGISSITNLSRVVKDTNSLNASMQRAMSYEKFYPEVKDAFASMQLELKCCGVHSHTDWYQHRFSLPPACCGRARNDKTEKNCDTPLYRTGCVRLARAELHMFSNSLAVLGCVLIIVKAVTLFAAAYTLVTNVLEQKTSAFKPPPPLRIACLSSPLLSLAPPMAPKAPAPI